MSADFPEIPGLVVESEIGRGATGVVYRARKGARTVALKLPLEASSGRADWFRREGALLACVRHPGLAEILEVAQLGDRPYLVREYVDGITLAAHLEGGPLDLSRVVRLGRELAGALAAVHRHGLVHRDVKPQNVVITPDGRARLIDYGLAARIDREPHPDRAVGTLLYSSPEQAGMLRRPVDGRSDLYSLGVVLFEAATGQLPFRSHDAGELARQHAVMAPPDPLDLSPGLSRDLASIVLRLLAKDPDDRYQTGESLVRDLEAVEAGRPPLLETSQPERVMAPILGRGRELTALLEAWGRVGREGVGQVVALRGDGGAGKSRLVAELVARVEAPVLWLRCSEDAPPFAALQEAVESYLSRTQEHELVRQAAGEGASFLAAFSPALAECLGATAAVHRDDRSQQFFEALARWLARLADLHHGALVVIDDAQWLDGASLPVFRRLVELLEGTPLLVLVSLREGGRGEELAAAARTSLELSALDEAAVAELVSFYLGGLKVEPGYSREIAHRCRGNPLMVEEYVRATLEQGLLRPCWGEWRFDAEGLERLALPREVLELIGRRLETLTPSAFSLLQTAAVVGRSFELSLLPKVTALTVEEVCHVLSQGVELQLLLHRGEERYAFVHDRVREGLLSGLEPEQRRRLHQQVAEALEGDDTLYARARHFAQGLVEQDPERVYRVNLEAGKRAIEQYAYEDALEFLESAGGLESPDLYVCLGEACERTGRHDEAARAYRSALELSQEPLQRARLRARLGRVELSRLYRGRARQEVNEAFDEIGVRRWNRLRPLAAVATATAFLAADALNLGRGSVTSERREWHQTVSQLCELSAIVAYLEMDSLAMLELGFRAGLSAHLAGDSPELVNSYCNCAVVASMIGLPSVAAHYLGKADTLSRRLGDPVSQAHYQLYEAICDDFQGEVRSAERTLRRLLEEQGRWLDTQDYVLACTALSWNLLLRGYAGPAWKWVRSALERATRPEASAVDLGILQRHAIGILSLLGRVGEAAALLEQVKERDREEEPTRYLEVNLLGHLVLFYLEQGEPGAAFEEVVTRFHGLGLRPNRIPVQRRHFYVFTAYARLAQAEAGGRLDGLRVALHELRKAAGPPILRAHCRVLEAALARLEGRERPCRRLLEEAVHLADHADNPWALHEAARQRALLLNSQGRARAARRWARVAFDLAREHGWTRRQDRLRREFSLGGTGDSLARTPGDHTSGMRTARLRRHLDALLELGLATSSVFAPRRQARIVLDQIIASLGAERGFLFLTEPAGGALQLLAGRSADRDDLDELTGYSTTVVNQVYRDRRPVVVSGSDQARAIGSQSAVLHDLRSIMAAPLFIRDQLQGVVYLDNRLARGVFSEEDLDILRALAGHVAIALESARNVELELEVQAEKRAREVSEELQSQLIQSSKMAAVGALAAGVAHELNTPLGVVLLSLQSARTEEVNDEVASLLSVAERAAGRAQGIVSKLLYYSREARVGEQQFPLGQIVDDTLQLIGHTLEMDGVKVETSLGPDLIVQCNQNELQQVLTNLLLNARDAVLEDPDASRVIRVATCAANGRARLEVEDQGPGIPPEVAERVFEPFFTTKPVGRGTGLGLSVSHQIVTRAGGRLFFERPPERGARFVVELPRLG